MSKKQEPKPKVQDTVYLRGDQYSPAMLLVKISKKEKIEFGFCHWVTSKFVDDKMVHENHQGEFPLVNLTTVPPPFSGGIYKG